MELWEYEKVLLLDIDTLAIQNIDCLFDLQAPAAMCRGMNNGLLSQHGKCIDGRFFFRREDDNVWPWGQAGGINAGVILLAPDLDIYKRMRSAVLSDEHPAHIAGAVPEQDFGEPRKATGHFDPAIDSASQGQGRGRGGEDRRSWIVRSRIEDCWEHLHALRPEASAD